MFQYFQSSALDVLSMFKIIQGVLLLVSENLFIRVGAEKSGFPQFLTETKLSKCLKILNRRYQFAGEKRYPNLRLQLSKVLDYRLSTPKRHNRGD